MGLGHFVVTDIEAFHALFFDSLKNTRYFFRTVGTFEFEGQEDLGSLGIIVPVDKFGRRTRMDDTVETNEATQYILRLEHCR